jgi:hypothetical protein
MEEDAPEQREERVGEHVVQQVVPVVAPAQPPGEDGGDADQRGGGAPEEDHRDDEGEEAARDLHLRLSGHCGQVAEDREGEQDREQRQIPVTGGGPQDGCRQSQQQADSHDDYRGAGWAEVGHLLWFGIG